jgi:hypothetical protein
MSRLRIAATRIFRLLPAGFILAGVYTTTAADAPKAIQSQQIRLQSKSAENIGETVKKEGDIIAAVRQKEQALPPLASDDYLTETADFLQFLDREIGNSTEKSPLENELLARKKVFLGRIAITAFKPDQTNAEIRRKGYWVLNVPQIWESDNTQRDVQNILNTAKELQISTPNTSKRLYKLVKQARGQIQDLLTRKIVSRAVLERTVSQIEALAEKEYMADTPNILDVLSFHAIRLEELALYDFDIGEPANALPQTPSLQLVTKAQASLQNLVDIVVNSQSKGLFTEKYQYYENDFRYRLALNAFLLGQLHEAKSELSVIITNPRNLKDWYNNPNMDHIYVFKFFRNPIIQDITKTKVGEKTASKDPYMSRRFFNARQLAIYTCALLDRYEKSVPRPSLHTVIEELLAFRNFDYRIVLEHAEQSDSEQAVANWNTDFLNKFEITGLSSKTTTSSCNGNADTAGEETTTQKLSAAYQLTAPKEEKGYIYVGGNLTYVEAKGLLSQLKKEKHERKFRGYLIRPKING